RTVAERGCRTSPSSSRLRGRPIPAVPVRVELDAPGGEHWTWGAAAAEDRVTGTALDFCLVVTPRRTLADTGLQVTGPAAAEWMTIAQAFAGAPTDGRLAGLFAPQPTGGRPWPRCGSGT